VAQDEQEGQDHPIDGGNQQQCGDDGCARKVPRQKDDAEDVKQPKCVCECLLLGEKFPLHEHGAGHAFRVTELFEVLKVPHKGRSVR
jgi:hypothetical protein